MGTILRANYEKLVRELDKKIEEDELNKGYYRVSKAYAHVKRLKRS